MLWEKLRNLRFEIGEVTMEMEAVQVAPECERRTTIVHLSPEAGARAEYGDGIGEDVTYDPEEHRAHTFPRIDLRGKWTLGTLSKHLDGIDLFPNGAPSQPAYRDYRRWAFESAALGYALKQNGLNIASALEREPKPVRFVSSNRAASIDEWLEL